MRSRTCEFLKVLTVILVLTAGALEIENKSGTNLLLLAILFALWELIETIKEQRP